MYTSDYTSAVLQVSGFSPSMLTSLCVLTEPALVDPMSSCSCSRTVRIHENVLALTDMLPSCRRCAMEEPAAQWKHIFLVYFLLPDTKYKAPSLNNYIKYSTHAVYSAEK